MGNLHRELVRVDDADAAVRLQVGTLLEAALPVGALGRVLRALGAHLELEGEARIDEQEVRLRAAPAPQELLGVLFAMWLVSLTLYASPWITQR